MTAPSPAMITTSWDDGHPLDLRIASMLTDHGLAGTFYAPKRWAKPTMDDAQLRSLSDAGFELGGHTIDHVVLTQTPDAEAAEQVRDARVWLSEVAGRDCTMFCPPTGRFNAKHLAMIADAGYSGLRTVELWSTDAPRNTSGGLLEMPTTLQAQPHGKPAVLRNLAKRRAAGNLLRMLKLGRTGHWLDHLGRLAEHTLAHGGVLHLWGHSWEVEAFAQWDRLNEAFSLLGSMTDSAPALTNGQVCERYRSSTESSPRN